MAGYSITIFLPDGLANGLRIAKRSHWTGEVLMCSRNHYPAVADREDFGRTGVYILLGPAENGTGGNRVYVGETDNVRTRIKNHDLGKSFWEDLIVITKTDGGLHKADVRHLEARLIALAGQSPLVVLENHTNPAPPEPTEAHKADLESFLDEVLAILRLLGVSAFPDRSHPAAGRPSDPSHAPGVHTPANAVVGEFSFSSGTAHGRMTVTADGRYVLHPGDGVLSEDKKGLSPSYKALRKMLRDDRKLVPIADNPSYSRLLADLPLPSPSAAGAVLYGGQVNGRTHWKDVNGKTLAECEATAVNNV